MVNILAEIDEIKASYNDLKARIGKLEMRPIEGVAEAKG